MVAGAIRRFGKGVVMKNRRAFTLVELLVVITIIGVLVALLLPAVQSARESGRKTTCSNNIKQLTMAAIAHESTFRHFPTGGWIWWWLGDPDRGAHQRQPGGWSYNILPFLGEQPLHDQGIGVNATTQASAKQALLAQSAQTSLGVFYCPTRRQAMAYPNPGNQCCNTLPVANSARTDYAANAGTYQTSAAGQSIFWGSCPRNGDPSFADVAGYQFPDTSGFDGIMFTVSMVTSGDISDGLTNTFMFGEKLMDPYHYTDGLEGTDNNPLYGGFDWDWSRWGALNGPSSTPVPPIHDIRGDDNQNTFGSSHIDGLNMFTCDGSGHWTSYSIDPQLFVYLCSRNDAQSITTPW
jgi:prepilin-type N-terminal cleavage/methylation domain-containing protein